MTLREMVTAILTQQDEPMSYRELTDALWATFPEYKAHMVTLYETEPQARKDQRLRLGLLVKAHPQRFTATMNEGLVLVGLPATDLDIEGEEEEEVMPEGAEAPSVYWYSYPAYQKEDGPYPIKVGRGNDARRRIAQQVTAMPESPIILGTYPHPDPSLLEGALHKVLALRGKRKKDAPGSEWFLTTPAEILSLIGLMLGDSK